MTQVQQHRLSGATGELSAVGYGDPSAPPILALHGWQDNADSFAPLAPLIQEHYILALDLAGHGGSAHRPAGSVYHMTDYAADVASAVADLGWGRFSLLGHSLGAGVSILYAAAFPDQVERLVLIDGLGPATGKAIDAADRLRRSMAAGLDGAPRRGSRIYRDWEQLIAARCQASPLERRSAELLVRRNAVEDEDGIRLRTDRRLRQPSPLYLTEELALSFITAIEAPGLLILAQEGMVADRETTQGRIAAYGDIKVVTLSGRHHLHMDTPESVAAEINRFLNDDKTVKSA